MDLKQARETNMAATNLSEIAADVSAVWRKQTGEAEWLISTGIITKLAHSAGTGAPLLTATWSAYAGTSARSTISTLPAHAW